MKRAIGIPAGILVAIGALHFAGCGPANIGGEDSSAGGLAAGAVGSALGGSSTVGTQTRRRSYGACPTLSAGNSACAAVNATTINLTYSACTFGTSAAAWSGTLQAAVSGTSLTLSCGVFPFNVSSTGNLSRQFVDGTNQPGSGTRTSTSGTVVTIDHATADLGNYQGDTIAANIGSGYGTVVTWTSGARSAIAIRQRVTATGFDHSIHGSVSVTETVGATSRTVTGSVLVYHNLLKVKGTATFNSVRYEDTCCVPVSGSVTTAFTATSESGDAGLALDGKSETLTFTGCRTGTLTDTNGATTSVTIEHCL